MASGEASGQTYVLKVPIHCEGCKKKVKKVLSKIYGVYDSDIDSMQNKVTVVSSVDADTLIKRLQKSGKHAEVWPNEKPTNPNPNDKKKNKSAPNSDENKKPCEDQEVAAGPVGNSETAGDGSCSAAAKPADVKEPTGKSKEAQADGETSEAVAAKSGVAEPAEAKPESSNDGSSAPPPYQKATDGAAPDPSMKVSSTRKKKGKKLQKENSAGDGPSEQLTENTTIGISGGGGSTPPHKPVYEHSVDQPQPIHAYSMAHPTTSYSYYAPAPPPAAQQYAPQAYAYSTHPPPPESYYSSYSSHQKPPESYYRAYSSHPPPTESYYSPYSAYPTPDSYYSHMEPQPQPSEESYDMFSDENANACKVM